MPLHLSSPLPDFCCEPGEIILALRVRSSDSPAPGSALTAVRLWTSFYATRGLRMLCTETEMPALSGSTPSARAEIGLEMATTETVATPTTNGHAWHVLSREAAAHELHVEPDHG